MFPTYVVFSAVNKNKNKMSEKEGSYAFFRDFNHKIHTEVLLFVLYVVLLSETLRQIFWYQLQISMA